MTFYFAYGSNMDRAAMAARCPGASALGVATLRGFRFLIGIEGWASVERAPGGIVHGVVWRIGPRDLAALHAYELLYKGLYDLRTVPVRQAECSRAALTYTLRRRGRGLPKPGYLASIVNAARDWNLPDRYVAELARHAISR